MVRALQRKIHLPLGAIPALITRTRGQGQGHTSLKSPPKSSTAN